MLLLHRNVEAPSARRSCKLELSVVACCSNDVGDRIPPNPRSPARDPGFPQTRRGPLLGAARPCRHREPPPGTSLKITTTLNIGHRAERLFSPALRFVEPNKTAARFPNGEAGSTGEESREEAVNSNSGSNYRNPAEYRRDHDELRDQFQRETILPLGAALIIIVLLSLGLWWAIWLAVSSLVPRLL